MSNAWVQPVKSLCQLRYPPYSPCQAPRGHSGRPAPPLAAVLSLPSLHPPPPAHTSHQLRLGGHPRLFPLLLAPGTLPAASHPCTGPLRAVWPCFPGINISASAG